MATLASTLPFRIAINDQVLEDLRLRLVRARRPRVLAKDGWQGGCDPDYLDELIRYWRDDYDWRRNERGLNQLSHFIAHMGEASVHFIHERGLGVCSTPVLLLHGWPDSFLRYRRVIPELVGSEHEDPESMTCDVVVPSLPGFAFTGQAGPTLEIPTIKMSAQLMHRLMTEVLGYEHYVVAGGDGGSAIAQSMAIQFPGAVTGIHLTDIGWHDHAGTQLTDIEQQFVDAAKRKFMEDGAYAAVHSSQPRALGACLNDSPAGLASWIVDRFHSWCDAPRHLEQSFTKDEILTNITIYWVTQTIQSSIYGYLAETRQPTLGPGDRVERPVALALFPKDMAGIPPRRLAERTLNVVRWTEMRSGGHFGAWERPAEFAADLKWFVRSLEDPVTLRVEHGYSAGEIV
jgi:pimeloyl-ACP methyl ester carboxylesterase